MMTGLRFEVSGLIMGIAVFGAGGCQDVQLDSTPNTEMEQTDPGGLSDNLQEAVAGPKVELEMLSQLKPTVSSQDRDPFRFGDVTEVEKHRPAIGDAAEDAAGMSSFGETRAVDDGQLNMIGVVRTGDETGRIAVLTDGSVVLHGRKGEIIAGRYRIVDVMPTAVMIEYIHDGVQQLVELSEF